MPNNYFQFKKFTIHQQACAMKVCTDACLFGAWVADYILQKNIQVDTILDIGSGTGLLSLMLAQKIKATIYGVETETDCIIQSRENVLAAQFETDILFLNERIQDFKPGKKFELIISNPPFYENDLQSPTEKLNLAKHDTGLRLTDLAFCLDNFLARNGVVAVLLPYKRAGEFVKLMEEYSFYNTGNITVHHAPGKMPFRSMLIFTKENQISLKETLFIKDEKGNYSKEFTRLLQPYYLNI